MQALAYYNRLSPWEEGVSLHESRDRGLTWTKVMTATDEGELNGLISAQEAQAPSGAATQPVRIVEYGDALEFLDSGGDWRRADLEQKEGETVRALAASPQHEQDDTYYALGDFSLWRTTDGGETWERWQDPRLAGRTFDNALTALAVTPPIADGSYHLLVGTNAGEFWILTPYDAGSVEPDQPTAQPAVQPTAERAETPAPDSAETAGATPAASR